MRRLKYNSDYMSRQMDKELEALEDRLKAIYANASYDVNAEFAKFAKTFEAKDAEMAKMVAEGSITDAEYSLWRQRQILQTDLYKASVDKMTVTMLNADITAMATINGDLPMVLAQSYNFVQSLGWKQADDAGLSVGTFQIYNADSVQTIIRDNPDLLKSVDVPVDKKWNKEKINNEIVSSIMKGDPIPKVAENLQKVAKMDENSAIRNARTAMTSAENLGRSESADRLKSQGIPVNEMWNATYDNRTRDTHLMLDGTMRDENGYFGADFLTTPLRYPADPLGDPEEVYNCRCRMSVVLEGIDHSQDGDLYEEFMKSQHPDDWEKMQENKGYQAKQEVIQGALERKESLLEAKAEAQQKEEKVEPSYPVATNREEATEILEGMFANIPRGVNYLDEDVYIANANKLSELDAKFDVMKTGDSRMSLLLGHTEGTGVTTKGWAEVQTSLGKVGSSSLIINMDIYTKNTEYWENRTSNAIEKNWWMPVSPENQSVMVITHEYGHIIENSITNTVDFAKESIKVWESDKSEDKAETIAWYTEQLEQKRDEIREEIISIAMENNPNFDLDSNISNYGKSSSGEFFAECFMNSQLGEPNELGDAMNIWLERKGLL